MECREEMPQPFDLTTQIKTLKLKNPVLTASGTFGYGIEFESLVDLNRLGGIIVKGLSLHPEPGNPPPRIVETPCGMLNAIGLENIGIDAFIREKLPLLVQYDTPIITNIYGKSVDDYARLAARIDGEGGIAGIEVNISCPNVKAGGVAFGIDPSAAATVIRAVRERTRLPLIAKLSPNVTSITEIARSVEDAGADAISLINTITGMAIDIESRRPKLGNVTGGLSGPAIKPIALRMVWEVARTVKVPVIGIGGIMSASDVLEFLIAGASAVEIGTANFVDPGSTIEIIDAIAAYLAKKNIADLRQIIGSLEV